MVVCMETLAITTSLDLLHGCHPFKLGASPQLENWGTVLSSAILLGFADSKEMAGT